MQELIIRRRIMRRIHSLIREKTRASNEDESLKCISTYIYL